MTRRSQQDSQGLKGHRCGEPLRVECRECNRPTAVIPVKESDALAYCNHCGEEEIIKDVMTKEESWFKLF